MMAILFAVCAAALYGSADFIGGLASRRSAVMPVMIVSQFAGSAMLLAVIPLLPSTSATTADLIWGTVAGVALGIGLMQLYQGLALGKMSVVAPVTAVLAVALSAVVGMLAGDRLSIIGLGGIVLAVTAIILISQGGEPNITNENATGGSGVLLITAVSAGLLIGVFYVAIKQASASGGLVALLSARITALVVLLGLAISRRSLITVGRDVVWLVILGGALDVTANVLYVLAARHGMLTIAATLTSLYPASTILLARFVLGERLRGVQIAGLACAGIGVALIGAG
jgi:drug/metabolite transporter (DMT)-like permease